MKAIEFLNVSKKFRKGENFDSLRDFIPGLAKAILGQKRKNDKLDEKEFWALRNVGFEVEKGECLGIIGPNGSGKSTTLKLLSKILEPTSGEIRIHGRLSALIEVGAGFHPDLTGRENIYLNGSIIGMKKKEITEKFDSIVEFSELEEFIDTPVKRYSSGMYVRLGFSVAAHMDPEILLIDEVLAVGDAHFQKKCLEKIKHFKNSNKTIIFISHNLFSVQGLCERTALLYKGCLKKMGETKEVINLYEALISEEERSAAESAKSNEDYGRKTAKSVEIQEIQLLNENRALNDDFDSGDKLIVNIKFYAKDKIEAPVFAVGLVTSDLLPCVTVTTKMNDFDIKEIHGKGEIEVEFENLNFNSGRFNVNVIIWDKDMLSFYDAKTRNGLTVKSKFEGIDKSNYGFFILAHKWRKLYG